MTDPNTAALTLSVLGAASGTILPSAVPTAPATAKPFLPVGSDCDLTAVPVDMNNIYNQFVTQAAYQYRI